MPNHCYQQVSIKGPSNLLYSVVVLDDESKEKLINSFTFPLDWQPVAHHMTIGFKEPVPDHLRNDIGKTVQLTVKEVGISRDAMAVKVLGYHSTNNIPHITLAIPKGGKPFKSNFITNWKPLEKRLFITGEVKEIYS